MRTMRWTFLSPLTSNWFSPGCRRPTYENGFARFPFRYKSVNLKMSEDETKDYLMVHSCYDSWISADHNRRLSNKNLHLNSLSIYCFTLISMTRKRGSGPWQKMVINKMYWQENNVRHSHRRSTSTQQKCALSPIQIFERICVTTNTYIDIQGEIQDMVKKRFMTQIFYPLKCISVKRISAVS